MLCNNYKNIFYSSDTFEYHISLLKKEGVGECEFKDNELYRYAYYEGKGKLYRICHSKECDGADEQFLLLSANLEDKCNFRLINLPKKSILKIKIISDGLLAYLRKYAFKMDWIKEKDVSTSKAEEA